MLDNLYSAPQADLTYIPAVDETYPPKFISIHGRLGRLRFLAFTWFLTIFLLIISVIIFVLIFAAIVSRLDPDTAVSLVTTYVTENTRLLVFLRSIILWLPIAIASLVYTKRRLNDLDRSGWFCFLILVPFLNLFGLFYLLFAPGSTGNNRYGAKPEKNSALLVVGILVPMLIIGIVTALVMPEYRKAMEQAKATAEASAEAAEKHQAP